MAPGGAILVMALFTVSFRMTTQLVIHVSTDNEAFMRHLKNGKEIFHILRSIADFLALLLLVQGIEPNPGPLSVGSVDDIDLSKKRQQCADPGSREMEVTTEDPTQTSEGESTLEAVGSVTVQRSHPLAANDVPSALDKDQIVDLPARVNHLDIRTVSALRQDTIDDKYCRSYSIGYKSTSQTEVEDDIAAVVITRNKDAQIVPMTHDEEEDIRMSYRFSPFARDARSLDMGDDDDSVDSDSDDDTASRTVSVHKAYPGIDVEDLEAIFGRGSSRQLTQGPSMDDDFCVSASSDNESIYDVTEDKTEDTATSSPVVNNYTKHISRSATFADDARSQYVDDDGDSVDSDWDNDQTSRSESMQNAYPGIDKDDLEAIFGRSSLRQSAQGPTMDDDFCVNSWSDDEFVDGAGVDQMGNDKTFDISPPAVIDDTKHIFRKETKGKIVTFAEKDTVVYFEKDMASLGDDDSVLYDDDYEEEDSSSDEDIIYDYTHSNDDESVVDRSSSSAIDAFSRDNDMTDNTAVNTVHDEDIHVTPVVHIDEEDIDMLFSKETKKKCVTFAEKDTVVYFEKDMTSLSDDDSVSYDDDSSSSDEDIIYDYTHDNDDESVVDRSSSSAIDTFSLNDDNADTTAVNKVHDEGIHVAPVVHIDEEDIDMLFRRGSPFSRQSVQGPSMDDDFRAYSSDTESIDEGDDDDDDDDDDKVATEDGDNIHSLTPVEVNNDKELNRQCTESNMPQNGNLALPEQALCKEDRCPILKLKNYICDTTASRLEMPVEELLPVRSGYPAIVLSSVLDSSSVDIFDTTSAASTNTISPTTVVESCQASPQEKKDSSHSMLVTASQTKPGQIHDTVPVDVCSVQHPTVPIVLSDIEISLLTSSQIQSLDILRKSQDLQPSTQGHKTQQVVSEVHTIHPSGFKSEEFCDYKKAKASTLVEMRNKETVDNAMMNLKCPDKDPDNIEMNDLDIIEDVHGILVSMFYKPELSSIDKYRMMSHDIHTNCQFLSQNADASFTKTDVVMEKMNDKTTNEHMNLYSDIVPEYLSLFTPNSGRTHSSKTGNNPKQPIRPTDATVNKSIKLSKGLKDGKKEKKSRITKFLHRMFH